MTDGKRPVAMRTPQALRRAAKRHCGEAIEALVEIVRTGASEHARVAAAKELLDRGHGRPPQAVKLGGDEGGSPIRQVIRWAVTEAETSPDPAANRAGGPQP